MMTTMSEPKKISASKVIYEPKGKAFEYAPLACNLYTGCSHGCTYCYAPGALRMKVDAFHANVKPRPDILERLDRDAAALADAGDEREILLSLSCDPFPDPKVVEGTGITMRALEILEKHGRKVAILTKGGLMRCNQFFPIILRNEWRFGVSLVWRSPSMASFWEPHAPPPGDRTMALQYAWSQGIKTWVSVETVIDPVEALLAIKSVKRYAGKIMIGKINHDSKLGRKVDWAEFVDDARALLLEEPKHNDFTFKVGTLAAAKTEAERKKKGGEPCADSNN